MSEYGLGIDAGGTYTDTVIVELDTGKVLCGNKSLTTRHNLSEGIRNSLSGLDRSLFDRISLTSLSSTLATNSVVEGKGCRVGLICIGVDYQGSADAQCYSLVDGRFSMSGKEEVRLDIRSAKRALEEMKGKVDAVAVSGYVSVRNPSHEERVAALAKKILGVPVVCAHDLTSKLGFVQRTTTVVMNARLIPVIKELLVSVKTVLSGFGIASPLMMVKGDGALMKDDTALLRPVETILSGPASSIMGAKSLTNVMDAVIVDMGGTTSDIGILKDGFPDVEPEGACIAGRRTRVLAADISTYGIGGDSRIVVNGRKILLSPVRVIPLCVAATKWKSVKDTVEGLAAITDDRSEEDCDLEEVVQDTEFFTLAQDNDRSDLEESDRRLLDLIENTPMRLSDAGRILGAPPHSFSAAELESRGFVTRIGVTPTDLLHAEGSYRQYDHDASAIAVGYLARKAGKTESEFISDAKDLVSKKIASAVMEKAMLDESGDDLTTTEQGIIDRILHPKTKGYSLGFTLGKPIIGIGAPVGAWLPEVARLLNTGLILPENSSIGNAIGAITGSVSETAVITVRASGPEMIEEPECDVFTGESIKTFARPQEAIAYAKSEGRKIARKAALASGAKNPVLDVDVEENYLEIPPAKKLFRSATVTVKATGKPDLR